MIPTQASASLPIVSSETIFPLSIRIGWRISPSSSSWETNTEVMFSCLQALTKASITLLDVSVSRLPVNSSPRSNVGRFAMLLAMAARCC